MFDLDAAVLAWRERVGRRSSLSQREVDELEDHLRARVGLEMELDGSLVPARAFALASEGLGDPAKLSKEFAKVGKLRWRRLMMAGWALFGVSFFLPALNGWTWPFGGEPDTVLGWEAFWCALSGGNRLETLSALTNVLMVLALVRSRRARAPRRRWHLTRLLCGSAAYNLSLWMLLMTEENSTESFGMGFWAWTASFVCVAAGLWVRAKGQASAEPAVSMAESG